METPLVSVISVFCNRQHHVKESVESLLRQTYSNIEIILVDDGSNDNTLALLKEYTSDKVKVIAQDNMGFTKSIKLAMESAKGEYLAVHGSGDLSLENRIELQVNALENDKEAMMCGVASENVNSETMQRVDTHIYPRNKVYLNDFKNGTPFTHGSVMYRRESYFLNLGYDSRLKFTQDWDLWLRMLTEGGYGLFISQIEYKRVNFPGGASNSAGKAVEQLMHGKIVHYLLENKQANRDEILKNGVDYTCFQGREKLLRGMKKELSRRALRLKINDMNLESKAMIKILKEQYGGVFFIDTLLMKIMTFMNLLGISNKSMSSLARKLVNIKRYATIAGN